MVNFCICCNCKTIKVVLHQYSIKIKTALTCDVYSFAELLQIIIYINWLRKKNKQKIFKTITKKVLIKPMGQVHVVLRMNWCLFLL